MRRLAFVLAAALLLLPSRAHLARAPDVVKQTFDTRGEAARAFAGLVGFPLDRPGLLDLELSQSAELRAMPERDAVLRDANGTLGPELAWRASTLVRLRLDWDPAAGGSLRATGWVHDMSTALPAQGGPRFRVVSPGFDGNAPPPGWRPLLTRLGGQSSMEVSLGENQVAILAVETSFEKRSLSLSFGPSAAKPGGCSR